MFTHKKTVWLYLLPGLLGLMLFYVVPFFSGVFFSLTDGTWQNRFVGLNNYIDLWQQPMFLTGIKNTMELTLISAPLTWGLALVLAVLLVRIKPAGAFFRSSILLPYLMPSSAMLLIWLIFFDYGGVFNRLIEFLGMERVMWLESAYLRFPIILMFVWKNVGFSLVIFLAALQAVPEPLYEYARLEGAGFWYTTCRITFPLIVPSAFLVFVMCWINAFKIFKEVYFIGGAYPDYSVYTLQNYMNNMYAKLNYQMVTTAAYSFGLIVFAIFGVLFYLQNRAQRALS